jgi:RNA polymerase sigma factor (sigma-70 family)
MTRCLDRPVTDSLPTTELLHIAVGGDPAAWEKIVRRFEPAVAAMITTYRLQEADARDATQRTWLRMLENHHQIREPEALGGWLKTTARRECLRILAEQRRIEPLPETTEFADGGVDIEGSVVDADQARVLRSLLAMLPARSYTLIRTLFQDEPPCYAELSAATGIPVGSIGPTRARALRRLRRMFEEGSGSVD